MEKTISALFAGIFGVAMVTALNRPETANNLDAFGRLIQKSTLAALGRSA